MIVSDTFGRTWRKGLTDVAIGCAGIAGVVDLRGTDDALGRVMQVTEVCVADELAGAAEMVMGKSAGIPVAVVRGVDPSWLRDGSVRDEIVRSPQDDLFRCRSLTEPVEDGGGAGSRASSTASNRDGSRPRAGSRTDRARSPGAGRSMQRRARHPGGRSPSSRTAS